MSQQQCVTFKNNLLSFMQELIAQFQSNPIFHLGHVVISAQDPQKLMEHFIKEIIPFRDHINRRDEERLFSLKENSPTYGEILNQLETLWVNLDNEDRDVMWQWIDSFVLMGVKFEKDRGSAINAA